MTKDSIIPLVLFVFGCLVAYFAWATGNLPR